MRSSGEHIRMWKKGAVLSVIVVAIAGVAFLVFTQTHKTLAATGPALQVDHARGEVRIAAIVHPGHLSRRLFQPGHHAVVWDKGRAHLGALFASRASDHDARAALASLGARPGENLTEEMWTARGDPRNPEPDKRVEGTPIDVFVEWPGSGGLVALGDLIAENGRRANFDFRFGGHERFQKDFKSGCIVCTYSCPGGAIGNRNRTIRDEENFGPIFTAVSRKLPPDGSAVTVVLKLRNRR